MFCSTNLYNCVVDALVMFPSVSSSLYGADEVKAARELKLTAEKASDRG